VLRLASEFQGFARELHDETASIVAATFAAGNAAAESVLHSAFTANRKLDRGNAEPSGLEQDFRLVGLQIWSAVKTRWPAWGPRCQQALAELNQARNGIAHDDARKLATLGRSLTLVTFKSWRGHLDRLATGMDHVVQAHLRALLGVDPW
jgi:hypothetical protein